MDLSSTERRHYSPAVRRTDCTEILKALADRNRIRLVKALLKSSLSVNELAETLTVSQYNASKHLRVLRHAGIVHARTNGTRREYYITPKFRTALHQDEHLLDFGCCTFHFDRMIS